MCCNVGNAILPAEFYGFHVIVNCRSVNVLNQNAKEQNTLTYSIQKYSHHCIAASRQYATVAALLLPLVYTLVVGVL
jgi:hypothetical protein